MYWPVLFIIGVAVGSFINVLATRYREDGRIFSADIISGRSRCDFCGQKLPWYELIPLISFLIQGGKCRHCHQRLTWQYPAVELITGLMFVFIPLYAAPAWIWLPAFAAILLMSLIDMRLWIIPDQVNWFLVLLGSALVINGAADGAWVSLAHSSLLGAMMAAAILGAIYLFTSEKGIGFGDVKLGIALGFLFGLPATLLIIAIAFVIGGAVATLLLLRGKKTMKEGMPFGQFLGLAAIIVLFFGGYILERYILYVQF